MSSWIKMGTGLASHGKVKAIRRALKADHLRVIGALWAVWCVFDEHSKAGRLSGYTLDDMDEEIGWPGFSAAMRDVGWLQEVDGSLEAPDYEEHNGPNAKRRALDASRKGKSRASAHGAEATADPVPHVVRTEAGHLSASMPDKCPQDSGTDKRREEEIREEKTDTSNPTGSHPPAEAVGQSRPTVPCPYEAIVEAYHQALPSLPRVRLVQPQRQKAMRRVWGWVLTSRKTDDTRRAETPEQALAWLASYFARASENDFLMGRGQRHGEHAGWVCDFDFLLTDKGMRHVIEKTQEQAA